MKLTRPIWRFVFITAFALTTGLVMVQPSLANAMTPPPPKVISADTITGQVTLSGIGLPSVHVNYVGSSASDASGSATTDSSGNYTIIVLPGWSGTVTPALAGYSFSPPNLPYVNVSAELTSQNYVATAYTPTPTLAVTATPTRTRTPTATTVKTRTPTPTNPSGFSKLYPWNVSHNIDYHVTFSWRAYTSSYEKYRYCYDKINNNSCDSPPGWTSVNAGTTSVSVTLAPNTTYYWQLQAVKCAECSPKVFEDSNSGAWWSFTTGGIATATPTRTPTRTPTKKPNWTPTQTPVPVSVSFASKAGADGWILESAENSGVGGTMNATGTGLPVGDNAANRQYRVILSFDTSSLPNSASILSAVLKVKQSGAVVGVNPFSILGNLWVDIQAGSFSGNPALQLSDFNAAASGIQVGAFGKTPVGGWYSAGLSGAGRNQINRTGVTQIRLYFGVDDNNDHVADFIKFLSGNSVTDMPVLVVRYR